MTSELPITNSTTIYVNYFSDKILSMDMEGVYYVVDNKRYYVHDAVMALAVRDGKKEGPPGGKKQWNEHLKKCDANIRKECRNVVV